MNILFDLDGVIIRGFHAKAERTYRWDQNLERDLGIAPKDLTEHFFEPEFDDVLRGKKPLKDSLQKALSALGHGDKTDELIVYWMTHDSNLDHEVIDIVKALRSRAIPLYLATNQEHIRAEYLWNTLKFKDYFQEIFYSAKIGHKKPEAAYFHTINDRIGAENILFFDDREDNIKAAHAAGWDAVVFNDLSDLTDHPVIRDILNKNK